jgi:hypothetical protein
LYSLANPTQLSTILNMLWLAVAGGSAMVLYFVLLWGLGVAEVRRLTALVWRRTTGSIKSSR